MVDDEAVGHICQEMDRILHRETIHNFHLQFGRQIAAAAAIDALLVVHWSSAMIDRVEMGEFI